MLSQSSSFSISFSISQSSSFSISSPYHSPVHSPYLLPLVSTFRNFITILLSPYCYDNFVGSFRKAVNRTRQISPLLNLNDFKIKSKLKWIFQSKEKHKTVNRTSWHHLNNLNMTEISILLILQIRFLTSKLCNTLWKKNNIWAYVVLKLILLWYPQAMTFLIFSWHSENFTLFTCCLCGVSSS